MTDTKLIWQEAKRLNNRTIAADVPCFEAMVDGGKYRAAAVRYAFDSAGNRVRPYVGYETFFIPTGAKSAADVRDIAEFLKSVDEAKTIAERDYEEQTR